MLKFLQRRRHTTDKGLHPKYYKLCFGLKLWHTPKMSFVLLEAYFDSPKKYILRPKLAIFLILQKFSVVSCRPTLPNNSKSARSVWVFIVLGINNFDYSQKRHQCIYRFYWQRLQPKCRSHWQNWSHWYQSGSGFSWEGIKFLQKKASPANILLHHS